MEPFFDIELLSNVLKEHDLQIEDIVSIIAQVAIVLCILCNRLDMNHRDMKTTNILLCRCTDGIAMKDIDIGNTSKITIKGKYCIKIVDFGFACSGTGRQTLINATTFFPMSDPCPKTGRDIFQLLTTMYLCTRFRDTICMKEPFGTLFKKWLTVPGNDYLAFLRTLGEDSLDWVYLLLGSDKFRAPFCSPNSILTDLNIAFPSVVNVSKADINGGVLNAPVTIAGTATLSGALQPPVSIN
jgi:serine/threonine protein kinase